MYKRIPCCGHWDEILGYIQLIGNLLRTLCVPDSKFKESENCLYKHSAVKKQASGSLEVN